jgi:hypothetical protein
MPNTRVACTVFQLSVYFKLLVFLKLCFAAFVDLFVFKIACYVTYV